MNHTDYIKGRDVIVIDTVIIYACKLLSFFCALFGGGSSLPGRVALKMRPRILSRLARRFKVIMVTGTNGKTTTSSMIAGVLEKAGYSVINNSSGANMTDGIASCFIANYGKSGWAVIECDEAYTRLVNKFLKPEYMVVTNIFRDQLDRFGEIYTTWDKIKEAIRMSPKTRLILNADEALFAKLDVDNPVTYYGFSVGQGEFTDNMDSAFCLSCGERFRFHFITFKNLGDYYCPHCGFARPKCSSYLSEMSHLSADGSDIVIDGEAIHLSVAGMYNMYNALAAFAVTKRMGVPPRLIAEGIAAQQSRFGRGETIRVADTEMQLSLIKNPTGCDQCIDTIALCNEPCSLLFMLNDKWADGTDVSWIWDAHFEHFCRMKYTSVILGGTRRFDMAIRVKTAGLDSSRFIICDSDEAILQAVAESPVRVFALCTYTAMTDLRKTMYTKHIVQDMWK